MLSINNQLGFLPYLSNYNWQPIDASSNIWGADQGPGGKPDGQDEWHCSRPPAGYTRSMDSVLNLVGNTPLVG
jgi:hypothetical protein